jgi:prepilin-type N-terminal cleavage/methylation domain-containing protein
MTMKSVGRGSLWGVTLTELLAVLVIVAILATLAIPAALHRQNQARFATARSEVQTLAQAEEAAALTHGFLVPLQVLDDVPIDQNTRDPETDDLQNEFGVNLFLIDVNTGLVAQVGRQQQLRNNSPDPRILAMLRDWAGPFAGFHRYYIGSGFVSGSGAQAARLSPQQVRRDFPLDPWGFPYRLYSPLGITGSTAGILVAPTDNEIDTDAFSNGIMTNTDDRFDRFAVVSFGPDGVSDGTTTSGGTANLPLLRDDVMYEFGGLVIRNETIFLFIPVVP